MTVFQAIKSNQLLAVRAFIFDKGRTRGMFTPELELR